MMKSKSSKKQRTRKIPTPKRNAFESTELDKSFTPYLTDGFGRPVENKHV